VQAAMTIEGFRGQNDNRCFRGGCCGAINILGN
jgi:hypothetical protein